MFSRKHDVDRVKSCTIKGAFISVAKYARRINLPFEMTYQDYRDLAVEPCYSCRQMTAGYECNMLKPVDKIKGFVKGNTVTLCWPCARKINKQYEQSERVMGTGSRPADGAPTPPAPTPAPNDIVTRKYSQKQLMGAVRYSRGLRYKFNTLRKSMLASGIPFQLTDIDYSKLLCSPCAICANHSKPRQLTSGWNVDWGTISLLSPADGYIYSNCVPMCLECAKRKARQTK